MSQHGSKLDIWIFESAEASHRWSPAKLMQSSLDSAKVSPVRRWPWTPSTWLVTEVWLLDLHHKKDLIWHPALRGAKTDLSLKLGMMLPISGQKVVVLVLACWLDTATISSYLNDSWSPFTSMKHRSSCLVRPLYAKDLRGSQPPGANVTLGIPRLREIIQTASRTKPRDRDRPGTQQILLALVPVIKGSLVGETSVLRTFRMSGKESVKERVSQRKS